MLASIPELALAPLLVAVATVATRRWGQAIGGTVSAFPAIVGPLLLIAALHHGNAFAARAASGTLLGLVSLSAFALFYGRTASRAGWRTSLTVGWTAAATIAVPLTTIHTTPVVAALAAGVSLFAAHCMLPARETSRVMAAPRWDLAMRMALTVALLASLTAAAGSLGPFVGGFLAALPVMASVLTVFAHRQHGDAAPVAFLRGMLSGMAAFVAFCLLVAVLVEQAGVPVTFCTATLAAVGLQAAATYRPRHRSLHTA